MAATAIIHHPPTFHQSPNPQHQNNHRTTTTTTNTTLSFTNRTDHDQHIFLREGVYHSHDHPKRTKPSSVVIDSLASALQECASSVSIQEGRQIHARVYQLGLSQDLYLSSQILHLYSSCAFMDEAQLVFNNTHNPNLFFWNTIIRGYTHSGLYSEALDLYLQMLAAGFLLPNNFTFPFVLKSCAVLQLLHLGKEIHATLLKTGYQSDVFVSTALMDMYAKCGSVGDARQLFDRIPQRSLVTWNSMISGYAQGGLSELSLGLIGMMSEDGFPPSVSTWNSLIAGFVCNGEGELALEYLRRMQLASSIKPNVATFNTLLPVMPTCASLVQLKEIHGYARKQGMMESDDKLIAALAVSYASHFGYLNYALRLFDEIQIKPLELWNSMISGFIDSGQFKEAFSIFREMMVMQKQAGEVNMSKVSLTLLLPECGQFSTTGCGPGEEIHAHAYRTGMEGDTSVSNALMAMYSRKEDIESAQRVFLLTPEKDVVSWNTMVSGYVHNQDYDRAFECFYQMHSGDTRPDEFTFGSVLRGCGHFASLRQGMMIHGYIIRSGFSENYCVVQNSLVDMYSKCGCIEEAEDLFREMPLRDFVSWNTMISCYSVNRRPNEAFSLFDNMQEDGWKPNRVTFIALLSACSHAGLVDKGLRYFETMSSEHGIIPDVGHYACIVDNLGRAGQLDKAYQLVKSMPVEPDDCVWGALLGGCRIHGNLLLAEVAAKHLVELEPRHSGYHILLSNIYAAAHRWNDVSQVRAAMKDKGVKKDPGCSWIEVNDMHHTFLTADKCHRQCGEIYSTLYGLTKQLSVAGYIPTIVNFEFKSSFNSHKLLPTT